MGPGISTGGHEFLPFRVNVATLFQEYVVSCAPEGFAVTRQYAAPATGDFEFEFRMDVAITDSRSGAVVAIVDAKYKRFSKPAPEDIEQVIAYSTHLGVRCAFLVYPVHLASTKALYFGPEQKLEVRMLGLSLDQNLNRSSP